MALIWSKAHSYHSLDELLGMMCGCFCELMKGESVPMLQADSLDTTPLSPLPTSHPSPAPENLSEASSPSRQAFNQTPIYSVTPLEYQSSAGGL